MRQLTCDFGFDELLSLGFLDVSVDEEEENRTSIDTLEIEMARTTRHVTLRWHSRKECRCQMTFVLLFLKASHIIVLALVVGGED